MASYDAAVIGGGIVGSATAYHLQKRGARTVLIDRGDPGRATDAGAGILSPETSTRYPDTWFDLALLAASYYPHLVQALGDETALDTGYSQCGLLLVAATQDEVDAFQSARRQIVDRYKLGAQSSTQGLLDLTPSEASEWFPPLASVQAAILSRNAARVEGTRLNAALRAAAEKGGLDVRYASVERLILESGRVVGVATTDKLISSGNVVIAGGAWSPKFGEQLGVQIPVEPQRGQILHLEVPNNNTSGWPMVSAFRGHYLVPWPHGQAVAGATRETGSGFAPYPTVQGVSETLAEALRVAPGLADAEIKEIRVGLRPLTQDHLPVLGKVPGLNGVFLATGHGSTGLTLGPFSGKVIADCVLDGEDPIELSAFHVSRFLDADQRQHGASARRQRAS